MTTLKTLFSVAAAADADDQARSRDHAVIGAELPCGDAVIGLSGPIRSLPRHRPPVSDRTPFVP